VSDIREQLIKLGWRQGSIIEAGAIAHEVFANQAGADAFLVLNQTCDVLNPSWEKEPFVEILPLSRIEKPNSATIPATSLAACVLRLSPTSASQHPPAAFKCSRFAHTPPHLFKFV
jgi:hypothetical protein